MSSPPDTSIAWHIWVGTIATIIPATAAVVCRLLSRRISGAGLWWDDWTIVLALIVNWAMAIIRWVAVLRFSYGRHAHYLPPATVTSFAKVFLAIQVLYFTDAVITKASLLLLFFRIFGVVRGFRYPLVVTGFMISGYFIACLVVSIAGCHPVSYFWNKKQPGGCVNEVQFFRWNGIANMLMDVLVLVLPLPMVWRLKTQMRQRLILCGIFLLGGFVCIVSILRIIAFNKSNPKDLTYTTIDTATWSSVEQSLGIVCACLPTMRPLFRRLYSGSKNDTSGHGAGSHIQSGNIQLSKLENGKTSWKQSVETGSTVGFARLPDEHASAASAKESYTSVYAPGKSTIQTSAVAGDRHESEEDVPSGILMRQDIHQTTHAL